MAISYEPLGNRNPAATTLEDAVTCGASQQMVVSGFTVCNRSSTATTFRIALAPNGEGNNNIHYLYYDVDLPGNETLLVNPGISLDNNDVLRVYVGAATVSFNFWGMVIT